jgi:hypothetical protein
MVRLRYRIVSVGALLAGVFLWGRCSRTNPPNGPVPAAVLPKNDTEQITVNPGKHTITVITSSGQKTVTLPDRTTTIDVLKNGQVAIKSPQIGFETRPFIGVGLGEGVRAYFGADLGYFKKADFGLALATPKLGGSEYNDFRGVVKASYNVYSNTSLNLGYDTSKTIHVFLSVRL